MIFMFDNMYNPLNIVTHILCMKKKNAKKLEENEKKGLEQEKMHEQMLEQTHQLELQKNYESDEKLDESTE